MGRVRQNFSGENPKVGKLPQEREKKHMKKEEKY